MEGFLIWGWDPILPDGAGFTDWGFHTVRDVIDLGDHRLRHRFLDL